MGVTSKKELIEQPKIIDDIPATVENAVIAVQEDKLQALKKKLAEKEGKTMTEGTTEVKRSIKFGVIGSGQAGSRISAHFASLGYPAVAVNTASQDLEHIALPEDNKLLLNYGLGGAAKELSIGAAAAEAYRDQIASLVKNKLSDAQVLIFCTSLGGGSGAGSVETIVDILTGMDCPIVVITVLPQSSEDAQIKYNAIQTLSKFTEMARHNKIHNLIVVDNAKIETIYSDVSQLNFFPVSNQAIVEPLDKFNTLTAMPSAVKGLDPTEFGKILTDGQGLSVYGTMKVKNYADETAIAEAVIENLGNSLLASGFDLKKAKYVGAIFAASEKVWNRIPSSSVNYAMSMINDVCGSPVGVYRGIYTIESDEDVVFVYSMFSGLSLPDSRIQQLKTEAKEKMVNAEKKNEERNLSLKFEAEEETLSAAEAIKKKIAAKKSSFGKLHDKAVIDRRK